MWRPAAAVCLLLQPGGSGRAQRKTGGPVTHRITICGWRAALQQLKHKHWGEVMKTSMWTEPATCALSRYRRLLWSRLGPEETFQMSSSHCKYVAWANRTTWTLKCSPLKWFGGHVAFSRCFSWCEIILHSSCGCKRCSSVPSDQLVGFLLGWNQQHVLLQRANLWTCRSHHSYRNTWIIINNWWSVAFQMKLNTLTDESLRILFGFGQTDKSSWTHLHIFLLQTVSECNTTKGVNEILLSLVDTDISDWSFQLQWLSGC